MKGAEGRWRQTWSSVAVVVAVVVVVAAAVLGAGACWWQGSCWPCGGGGARRRWKEIKKKNQHSSLTFEAFRRINP